MVKEHGSLTSGEGARYQPSFNFSVRLSEIEAGLRTLYETIVTMNKWILNLGSQALQKIEGNCWCWRPWCFPFDFHCHISRNCHSSNLRNQGFCMQGNNNF
mmetsp:Transcript_19000/g.28892  ORF Transcript_19000/g.28892 Transcript_19000/m.28892 type:complete len:101 (+) Transcript_19000:1521-1823(+)